jgi:hypothetical protein
MGELEDIFNVIENHWDEIRYLQLSKEEVEVNNRHFYSWFVDLGEVDVDLDVDLDFVLVGTFVDVEDSILLYVEEYFNYHVEFIRYFQKLNGISLLITL